jgi:TonB family protein
MRIVRSFVSTGAIMLLSVTLADSVCFAQSSQKINVASLLAEGGYKYVEVRDGLWRISEMPYKGKNLKNLDLFFQPDANNNFLRISLRLGPLNSPEENTELKEKLTDLNKRFKPTEFPLTKTALFAVTDLPVDKLDKKVLALGIEKVAEAADQAYPELTKYMFKESLGPGAGMGMGSRDPNEPNASSSNSPGNSEIKIVTTRVDSRPVLLKRALPQYTEEARRNKVVGTVTLRILVDETGRVKDVRVTSGLPDGLTEKAIEAARKTEFKPAMKDGKPAAFWMSVVFTFDLR